MIDGPARTITEMHRFGGTVAGAGGEPVAGAWVALPGLGVLATTDADGRFRFDRVPSGRHAVEVRSPDGGEAKADIDVPGAKADLVVRGRK
jgi:hypothetical protein